MTNPNDPKNNGKDAHRIERPDAGRADNAGRVGREEKLSPRGGQEHVAPRNGDRVTDPVRENRQEVRREQPVREKTVHEKPVQPRRDAEPVKDEGSNPMKWLLPLLALLILAGLLWWWLSGNNDDDNEAPATTEAATSEVATSEAETATGTEKPVNGQEDEAANAEADAFVKEQLGIQNYDELAGDPAAWGGHVDKVRTDGNNLIVDLDVDKGSEESQDLGKNAATEVADFIRGNKDDDRVSATNFVKVNDKAGDLIEQENV